jgi:predicted Zn-dependent protease
MPGTGQCVRSFRLAASWVLGVLAVAVLFACETVPITGRQQLVLMSPSEENRLGITAYDQVLKEEKLSRDPQLNAIVTHVGQRIAAVAERPDYAWEFRVIEKDVANAFALPGGKVAVYTGIFKYTQTDAGLAVVMGHEVAHALARHGGERISRSMIAQLGLAAVQIGLGVRTRQLSRGLGWPMA